MIYFVEVCRLEKLNLFQILLFKSLYRYRYMPNIRYASKLDQPEPDPHHDVAIAHCSFSSATPSIIHPSLIRKYHQLRVDSDSLICKKMPKLKKKWLHKVYCEKNLRLLYISIRSDTQTVCTVLAY
jgi:hypothetical protein